MTHHLDNVQPCLDLGGAFSETAPSAGDKKNAPSVRPSPVSVRFTAQEKARLEKDAGNLAISEHIRKLVLADEAMERAKQHRKKKRAPAVDAMFIAKLLGALGQSEMTQVLFALLLAAKAGELETLPNAAEKLDTACNHIADMREMLILALNVKPKGKRA